MVDNYDRVMRVKGAVAKFSLKRIDRGLQNIRNVLTSIELDKTYVKAGVLGKKAVAPRPAAPNETGTPRQVLTNVQLAMIHEFGSPAQGIPERSFIRAAFARHRQEYRDLLKALVKQTVYSGKRTYPQALGIVGLKMAADMKKFVTVGPEVPPPNSRRWFLHKLEKAYRRRRKVQGPLLPPRTLVDTGRMVGSITHVVVHRSTGDERAEAKGGAR